MDYREATTFLFDLRRFRMTPGTDATAALLEHLGDPHEGPRFVQVAGSNGKGSTARMVDTVCREAGLDVGLYTSPHTDDLRERVRVNDRLIPERTVTTFVETVRDYVIDRAADGSAPTFFEVLTAMALWHFDREDVDVAVLEVGIGGRYDATSVVSPVASAVTAVTLEHTDVLGDTVAEIARDKAQVAPADGPLVTATTGEALSAIRDEAAEVVTVGDDGDVHVTYGGLTERYESAVSIEAGEWRVETALGMAGSHQARNAGVAAVLAREIADVDEPTLARGLQRAWWPARFEVVSRSPLVVLDGAHNPGACAALGETLSEVDYEALHCVFGAMNDKDQAGMAAALPTPDRVLTCRPELDRSEDPAVLARVFRRMSSDATVVPSVAAAVDRAIRGADPGDCVLVTGSLYTVGEARRRWTHPPVQVSATADEAIFHTLQRAHVPPDAIDRLRYAGHHRAFRHRLGQGSAAELADHLRSVGGMVAVSGIRGEHEPVDVVTAGTVEQYERAIESLGAAGRSPLVAELERALDGPNRYQRPDHPWSAPAIMGVLNVTPDSFHDGGEYDALDDAVARATAMAEAGADIVDVGGESTRPGADPVPVETEIDRVVPVIDHLSDLDVTLSVDTRKAAVAKAALDAGADMLNDVSGLEDPEMAPLAADHDVPLAVMHSIDAPVVPGREIEYDDVVDDVRRSLSETLIRAEAAGLDRSQLLVDPGLGFGKSAAESFELLDRIDEFHALGCPVLVGHSHKSMFGAIDRYPDEGGYATVAATALAADRGADVIRVHDVAENVAAVRTALAVWTGNNE